VGAPKLAIDHVAVPVRDAAATRWFYSEVLGLALIEAICGDDWEGFPWLMMIYADASGRQIALCAYRGRHHTRERIPSDSRHYALATASAREMGAWKKRLREAHVAFREEDHGKQRSIYFEDPSGNILEITSSPSRRHVVRARKAAAKRTVDRWVIAGRAASSRASPGPRPSPRSRGGSDAGHDGRPGRTRSRQ
jgi:catechol 2,3-dioxygenase-like lactoylglutathione lyase family enzyme